MERFKLNKRGFTLAETLITLGIIGIVAALVMPAQITKYQKNTTVEKLKKVMSELNQAMKISQTANGDYSEWTKPDSNFTYDDFSNQYLIPYMKVSKICSTHSSCGYKAAYPWKYIDSVTTHGYPLIDETSHPFRLSDGTLIKLYYTYTYNSLIFKIDLNGPQGPNRFGRDVFVFAINEKGYVTPYPASKDRNDLHYMRTYCSYKSTSSTSGEWCARKIEYDGWKIKDDYPW